MFHFFGHNYGENVKFKKTKIKTFVFKKNILYVYFLMFRCFSLHLSMLQCRTFPGLTINDPSTQKLTAAYGSFFIVFQIFLLYSPWALPVSIFFGPDDVAARRKLGCLCHAFSSSFKTKHHPTKPVWKSIKFSLLNFHTNSTSFMNINLSYTYIYLTY